MKLVKMSLAAAMLMGASAYAIDNVKASGTASLFYTTQDNSQYMTTNTPDMFSKEASAADFALSLGVTADLTTGVSAGVTAYAVSTLGVEGSLVNGVWSGAHGVSDNANSGFLGGAGGLTTGVEVDDAYWVGEAWVAGTVGKTTAKLGRMALDTPLAFTETWGITPNTFEAAVVMNQDIPDTTLVGAFVGKYNGGNAVTDGVENTVTLAPQFGGTTVSLGNMGMGIVGVGGKFHNFYNSGAFALAAVNNSWKPLTVQGWYYELPSVAEAYWLQADLNIEGILAGVQYANIDASEALGAGTQDDKAYALMVGYALKDVATFKFAYSEVDDQGGLGSVNNLATSTGQSKLYTELWWNFAAGNTGTETYALTAEGTAGGVDLFAGYYDAETDPFGGLLDTTEVTEFVVTAGKDFGPLNATLALIYDEFDQNAVWTAGQTQDSTIFQAYLTYNF
jgi:hypothetical protein